MIREVFSQNHGDAVRYTGGGRRREHVPSVRPDGKAYFRMSQRQAGDRIQAGALLGGFCLEKLPARRHIGKKLRHRNLRAGRKTRRSNFGNRSGLNQSPRPGQIIRATGQKLHAGDGGNAGHRLTAKAERSGIINIIDPDDFAGGVAFKNQRDIFPFDAGSVVRNPNGAASAFLNLDADVAAPGINGVFHQLLDDRRRPFHHFPGRNLVGHFFG